HHEQAGKRPFLRHAGQPSARPPGRPSSVGLGWLGSAMPEHTTYRLVPPDTLDTQRLGRGGDLARDKRRVVDHESGPLLVLAGPGTGKTTTLVEAIVERIEKRDADPAQVLALTFSRKAAEQLRDRVTARLGRTTGAAMCSTIHSFAYALIRRYAPRELY